MQTTIPMGDLPGWALPVIVALVAVQLAVEIYALVVMVRTPLERLVFGKRWPWVVIILFVNLVGAIVFLAAGRKPLPAVDPLTAPTPDAPPVAQAARAARAADVLYGDTSAPGDPR